MFNFVLGVILTAALVGAFSGFNMHPLDRATRIAFAVTAVLLALVGAVALLGSIALGACLLCFPTYCLAALYVGSPRRPRSPDNRGSRRCPQCRQSIGSNHPMIRPSIRYI